jgi:hypothetical protein
MCSLCGATVVNIRTPTSEYSDKTITTIKQFSYPRRVYFWKHTVLIADITQAWPHMVGYASMRRMTNPTKECKKDKTFYF